MAHLILGYTPISKSYQVLKCVIKAKDPRLHRISVAAPGFLTIGPIPEGILSINPILEGIPKVPLPPQYKTEKATSSHPAIKEKEEEKEEEIVNVSDSEDDYEVFNQPQSLKTPIGDLGQPLPAQSSHHQEVTFIPYDMGM